MTDNPPHRRQPAQSCSSRSVPTRAQADRDRIQRAHWTIDALAARWAVSARTVRRIIQGGRLRAIRIGGQLRVPPEAVARFEERQEVGLRLTSDVSTADKS
jgi:excisionase family DNA binding protein